MADTKIKAKLNHLRLSPRKVRLATRLIAGLSVVEAQKQLQFLNKKAALPLGKLLRSAVANAENNFSLPKDTLKVETILVNAGPTMKRWLPRAMGRATAIRKRTCQIELTLISASQPLTTKAIKKPASQPAVTQDKLKEKPKKSSPVAPIEKEKLPKQTEKRPYGSSPRAKKRFFSRQTAGGNLGKKIFQRKSI
ncbi:MAG: 50S ribosomal protein L22 [Candidatus Portnoybacteria bacterium CG10_big_fil_rev_8_21_14_0_10_44_7]|uniref:Large ribosomal subunit protein uL22 n=1 Tax=Candidatus Portnoybacteria bacterium CG10_big_fil_rev_8_21_14_0_10_44_7 TaxID=1974816 RepID=A0A2M8KIU0_9BACT|nr:MAG: 50S ribosomal protein L22 [Candidatus Portnoybacteria bacterium CG10_big_fil_rev_8_21_14_0_10_44_7]